MNFPSPAVPGQIYAPPGGPVYEFNDGIWSTAMSGPQVSPGKRAIVSPFDFGGIGDGVADDTSAIQQAIDYLYNTFVGGTVDMSGGRWLVDSGNIVMKTGVQLVGHWYNMGHVYNDAAHATADWAWERSCIVLNPLYTIDMASQCGVKGLFIIRKGIVPRVYTPRAARDAYNLFAGTAIKISDGVNNYDPECYIGYCFIAGFNQAVNADFNGRSHIEYVSGDNVNGIRIRKSLDMQHMSHCHFWPFVNGGNVVYTVSAVANNGSGLFRLTTSVPHVLITGDIVSAWGVGGLPQIGTQSRWTVTVINSTTIDLQGSTYAAGFTAGGNVCLNGSARFGAAYRFDQVDWGQADSCFAFGYDIGFDIIDSEHVHLVNCGVDHSAGANDYTTTGIKLSGSCNSPQIVNCKTAAAATGISVDITAGFAASIIGCNCWGLRLVGIKVITGYAIVTGTHFYGVPTGISVDPASDGVHLSANKALAGVTTPLVLTGAALRKSTVLYNSWTDLTVGVARQVVPQNSTRGHFWAEYSTGAAGLGFVYQKARGTIDAPLAAAANDLALTETYQAWDGVSQFRTIAGHRVAALGNTSDTNSGGFHIWSATAQDAIAATDVINLTADALYPTTHLGATLGKSTSYFGNVFGGYLTIRENMAVPPLFSGGASLFITSDGDLKIQFADGVIKTIMIDT